MADNTTGKQLLPFGRNNYIVVVAGFAVILLGYLLMSTEDFIDATQFSKALHISPILILIGLIAVGYGIMMRPKTPATQDEEQG